MRSASGVKWSVVVSIYIYNYVCGRKEYLNRTFFTCNFQIQVYFFLLRIPSSYMWPDLGKSTISLRTVSGIHVKYFSLQYGKNYYFSYGSEVLALLSAPALKTQHWEKKNIYNLTSVCALIRIIRTAIHFLNSTRKHGFLKLLVWRVDTT